MERHPAAGRLARGLGVVVARGVVGAARGAAGAWGGAPGGFGEPGCQGDATQVNGALSQFTECFQIHSAEFTKRVW